MSASSIDKQLFDSYAVTGSAFDELYDAGQVRAHWQKLVDVVNSQSAEELNDRTRTAQQLLSQHGVTFKVFDDNEATFRPWEMDLLPFVVSASDWDLISKAIDQRARLFDLVIRDLYGPQELIKSGQIPPAVLFDQPGYIRAFHDLLPYDQVHLHYYGVELARSPAGQWWVMADRTDIADGAGYALEHRVISSRSMPTLIKRLNVKRLAPFFYKLRSAFESLAPRSTEFPRVALLSPGPGHPGYFEDQFLARYLGFQLVEGGDLAVRNDHVALKTLEGLLPIDVIFRRSAEGFVDPVELGASSPDGIPGLLQAMRAGNVAVVNVPGCRLVETPVFMAFLPQLCRKLLDEDLAIPSIATWWCGDEKGSKIAFDRFDELVIKPAYRSAGAEEFIVSDLSDAEKNSLRAKMTAAPGKFVAQEKITRSAAPVWKSSHVESGHVALRAFAVRTSEKYECMPGALVRVASDDGPMELSASAGEFSKDAWVLGDEPAGTETLMSPDDAEVTLVRSSSQLPSRSADNLYWLGRQLDRAINNARLMRAVCERLAGEMDFDEIPELSALLRVLSTEGILDAGYAIKDIAETLPPLEEAVPEAVFDPNESSSLRCTLDEIYRLASLVRDRISYDTWQSIRLQNSEFVLPRLPSRLSETIVVLDRLLLGLAGCAGLIHDGMVYGPSRQFLDMGRRVERCHWMTAVLKNVICQVDDKKTLNFCLNALVDVFDCRITYRSRYLSAVKLAPLLDLILCDKTNPSSLAAQVYGLSDHVQNLKRDPTFAVRSPEEKYMLSCRYLIDMIDVRDLAAEPSIRLDTFLTDVLAAVDAVADEITRTYLIHTGDIRQIIDEGPQPL